MFCELCFLGLYFFSVNISFPKSTFLCIFWLIYFHFYIITFEWEYYNFYLPCWWTFPPTHYFFFLLNWLANAFCSFLSFSKYYLLVLSAFFFNIILFSEDCVPGCRVSLACNTFDVDVANSSVVTQSWAIGFCVQNRQGGYTEGNDGCQNMSYYFREFNSNIWKTNSWSEIFIAEQNMAMLIL